MKIHEYQAKKILSDFGVPVPEGMVCSTVEEVGEAASKLISGGTPVVVKAAVKAEVSNWSKVRKRRPRRLRGF